MLKQLTDNDYISMLKKSADNAAFRHNLLANNISNVNTPGYKRRDTADFERMLREATKRESFKAQTVNPRHIQFGRKNLDQLHPVAITQDQTRYRNDKSSVDIDLEMAEVSKNGLRYQAYIKEIGGYFTSLKGILQKA